jgi:hypothetical protein
VRKDIIPYYTALGLSPGAEPIEIRRAYRRLVQQWHPDLYKAGSFMQTTAEDITKEINEAYDQLYRKKLYRNFVPAAGRAKKSVTKEKKSAGNAVGDGNASDPTSSKPKSRFTRQATKGPSASTKASPRFRGHHWARVALALCSAGAMVPFCHIFVDPSSFVGLGARSLATESASTQVAGSIVHANASPEVSGNGPTAVASTVAPIRQSVSSLSASEQLRDLTQRQVQFRYRSPTKEISFRQPNRAVLLARAETLLDVIEIGDTKAKVIEIQGVPDEAGETIFRYGSSVVYFGNGLVKGWMDRNPRLHIRDWSETALPRLDTFSLGSTRGDVIRAQGRPGSFSDSQYSFGSSVVFFDRDFVSGWSEGDVRLQNFALPSLPFIDLDQMELWRKPGPLEF